MRKYERVKLIEDTTMRIVAEKTIVGFSMRELSKRSGVNQSVIYRDFNSKEKLLRSCYEEIEKEINTLFQKMITESRNCNIEEYDQIRIAERYWQKYISMLIGDDYKTIYYCEYKECFAKGETYRFFTKSMQIRERSDWYEGRVYGAEKLLMEKMVMTYFLDAALDYAKKVIHKIIIDSAENREMFWHFLKDGIDKKESYF